VLPVSLTDYLRLGLDTKSCLDKISADVSTPKLKVLSILCKAYTNLK
jgi:hypothetical protein